MNHYSYYQQTQMAEQKVQEYRSQASQARAIKAAQTYSYSWRNQVARMMRRMADWVATEPAIPSEDQASRAA